MKKLLVIFALVYAAAYAETEAEFRARQQKYSDELERKFPQVKDKTKGWGKEMDRVLNILNTPKGRGIHEFATASIMIADMALLSLTAKARGLERIKVAYLHRCFMSLKISVEFREGLTSKRLSDKPQSSEKR